MIEMESQERITDESTNRKEKDTKSMHNEYNEEYVKNLNIKL